MNFAKNLARSIKETAQAETLTVGALTITTQRQLAEGGSVQCAPSHSCWFSIGIEIIPLTDSSCI